MFSLIRNILFDLGGVLYKIEYERVEQAFARLQASSSLNSTSHAVRYTRFTQPVVFTQYEIGSISTATFRDGLRTELGLHGSDDEIDAAWNSMLLGVYDGREEMLAQLKPRFNTALLSNTNELHIAYVRDECTGIFSQLDRLFFSYEMGTRKPEPAIFQMALDALGWKADETLFIDDSPQHLQGAQTLGIHTLWLQNAEDLPHTAQMLLSAHIRS
jgi:putative hydrolase of the HAD superfamily